MGTSHITSNVECTGTMKIGSGGTAISKILKGTVSVTVAATAAAGEEDVQLTITGAAAGDSVIMTPPNSAAEAGLTVGLAWVSAADTVKVRLSNVNAAAALSGSTSNWTYTIIKS